MKRALVLAALVAPLAADFAHAPESLAQSLDPGLRRFALIAGNDDGGGDTKPLLYATADARKLHSVLTQLGGVRLEDAVLLQNRSASDFLGALGAIEARAAAATRAGQHTALVVYYSGHAKDGDLRLGDSRLPLAALKDRLAHASTADVRIGIFDACRSGVVTRSKGARKGPAFEVQTDGGEESRGLVLLTSSSLDEDSQESDALGGSYFSHHLASGLRGSADRSGDRRVTLAEAYEYAYARTVAETAETAAGAQHPTFSYDLKGSGNLVLTELGRGREGLYLPAAAPAGTYYLVESQRGVVAVEVVKTADADRLVAIAPGRYRVKRRLNDRLRLGDVDIAAGKIVTLEEARLRDAPFSDDPVKGASREMAARWSMNVSTSVQAFFDAPTRQGLFPPTALLAGELLVSDFFRRHWVWGVDLAVGGTRGNLQREAAGYDLAYRFSEAQLGTSLFTEWPLAGGHVTPFFGGRLAFMAMNRTFEGDAASIPAQKFATFSPGVLGGVRFGLGYGFSLAARARVHYLLYNVGENNRSLSYWELATALGYEF
jgi:hypothetical protein